MHLPAELETPPIRGAKKNGIGLVWPELLPSRWLLASMLVVLGESVFVQGQGMGRVWRTRDIPQVIDPVVEQQLLERINIMEKRIASLRDLGKQIDAHDFGTSQLVAIQVGVDLPSPVEGEDQTTEELADTDDSEDGSNTEDDEEEGETSQNGLGALEERLVNLGNQVDGLLAYF